VKKDIHPDYHKVLFVDSATGDQWVTRSTLTSNEKREVDGEQIPVVHLEISSFSHPFWTGQLRELDSDGKIDRFRRRFGGAKKK
jgi:large subunit ribosomal protein L31